jgi:hypothetical protein
MAGTDAVDNGKLDPDADGENVLADVSAGRENEGTGGERLSEDADAVEDPDVDGPRKEDDDD